VTLFSNGERVAQGPVSTGTASHPTPLGVFSILEKSRHHRSNLYSNAPMPYMQRLTWSGVALHEGMLPGYPASHGCIRLSRDFASKLWPTTRLGARVIVAHNELAPVDFHHSKLFQPREKPEEPAVTMNPPTEGMSASRPIHLAQAPAADAQTSTTDAAQMQPVKRAVAADSAQGATEGAITKPAAHVDDADAAKPVVAEQPASAAGTQEPVQSTGASAPLQAGELRSSLELPPSSESPAAAQPSPAAAQPVPAAPEPAAGASPDDPEKPSPAVDPVKPIVPRTRSADQPVKRTGQVAVFISRKEKRIFVRQGFVPLFDMPVEIDEPDQPLGTHVFTALGITNGAGMRWNLFTLPTDGSLGEASPRRRSKLLPKPVTQTRAPSSAAEALDRIHMPAPAVERISELLVTGSSLVISDQGLGRETGRYTEFIVVTR
jgi:hypothetical protein